MRNVHAQRKTGFTLIELLVVVAIIAVLVALLLPALSSVRERTRRVMCASQLRQISTAFIAYAQDYRVFPAGKRWKIATGFCPFILDLGVADELARYYGLATNEEKRPGDWAEFAYAGIWNCPSNPTSIRGFDRKWNKVFYSDRYMIQTRLNEVRGCSGAEYKGQLSPGKPEDGVGPLLADKIQFWLGAMPAWTVNHFTGGGEFAGYNQACSDGHAEWYDGKLIAGQKFDHWIYRRLGDALYYWYEPNWTPPFSD